MAWDYLRNIKKLKCEKFDQVNTTCILWLILHMIYFVNKGFAVKKRFSSSLSEEDMINNFTGKLFAVFNTVEGNE